MFAHKFLFHSSGSDCGRKMWVVPYSCVLNFLVQSIVLNFSCAECLTVDPSICLLRITNSGALLDRYCLSSAVEKQMC